MTGISRQDLIALRLASHRLAARPPNATECKQVDQAVQWMGVVQAQEYAHARWAAGSRLPAEAAVTDAAVEEALAQRKVVRSWILRGTLHLAAAADLRWLLALAAPALLTRTAAAYREVNLDEAAFRKILPAIRQCLQGGQQLTREELFAALARRRIDTEGQRGGRILYRAAQVGLICLGDPQGKQARYALLDEWLAPQPEIPREDALHKLAQRYFASHGPATLADFSWWAGLAAGEARAALEMAGPSLNHALFEGSTVWWAKRTPEVAQPAGKHALQLLAGFDEYVLGYTDRQAVIDTEHAGKLMTPNGLFRPALLLGGRVAGTWQAEVKKGTLTISTAPFIPLPRGSAGALRLAAQRYSAFMGVPLAEVR